MSECPILQQLSCIQLWALSWWFILAPQYGSSTYGEFLSSPLGRDTHALLVWDPREFGLFMYKNQGGEVRGSRALDALLLLVEAGALYSSLLKFRACCALDRESNLEHRVAHKHARNLGRVARLSRPARGRNNAQNSGRVACLIKRQMLA